MLKSFLKMLRPMDKAEATFIKENVRSLNYDEKDNSVIPNLTTKSEIVKLDSLQMIDRLKDMSNYHNLFSNLRLNSEINTKAFGNDNIRNGYYPTPDAEIYAYMIASFKPERIIEIGSGYSTIIAKNTINFCNLNTEIKIIDPQPRTSIDKYVDTKILKPVEKTNIDDFITKEKTIIFIDSSHILRGGGDLPFIYNRLLPQLPENYLIHVHDIFIPYDYPPIYHNWYYTEQYLLYAILTNNEKFRIEFATHYMCRTNSKAVEEALKTKSISEKNLFGASFWFSSKK